MFSENTLVGVSTRFTAGSISCEMATGDISSVAQISHLSFCKLIIVAQNPVEGWS